MGSLMLGASLPIFARSRQFQMRVEADAMKQMAQAGAVDRVRPRMMTTVAIMAGLLPILWGSGTGASVMKRIAAPMVGGMISSTVLTLIVIPAVYSLWKERAVRSADARAIQSPSYPPVTNVAGVTSSTAAVE